MTIKYYSPHPSLASAVRHYTILETDVDGLDANVLPHNGLIMALQFKGQVVIRKASAEVPVPSQALSGIRTSPRNFHYAPHTGTLLVAFTETGAFEFFSQPLHEVFERVASLEDMTSAPQVSGLHECLVTAPSHHARALVVDRFLLQLRRHAIRDHAIRVALDEMYLHRGTEPVARLATRLGIALDTLEKQFRMVTGATPKQFANIIRLKHLIAAHAELTSLTDLAYAYNYYDQSHFVRQFKRFTGQSPNRFFSVPYPW